MGYVSMGGLSSDAFNSTKYPGVCKPSTASALAVFKRLQSQLNRVASVKGIATIPVDGDVGPGTTGLFGKVQSSLAAHAASKVASMGAAAAIVATSAADCTQVASVADVIADVADSYADSLNAPASPPAPKPIKPPMLVKQDGTEAPPPAGSALLVAFESAPASYKIGLLVVAGGIAYYAVGPGRKRRGRR